MAETSLFEGGEEKISFEVPLAERMRPRVLDEYVGQRHVLAPGKALRSMLDGGKAPSCILYGPPGVGKTTLVRLIARTTGRVLLEINAVSAKVETLRELVERACGEKKISGRSAIAFVDEIYHFNSKQQNVLLPSVETGDLILIGTTTENPWFEINKTLLSRMVVYTLEPLKDEDICELLTRALNDEERGLGRLGNGQRYVGLDGPQLAVQVGEGDDLCVRQKALILLIQGVFLKAGRAVFAVAGLLIQGTQAEGRLFGGGKAVEFDLHNIPTSLIRYKFYYTLVQ